MSVPFVTDLDVTYGEVDRVSPAIRRVVADNPSKFTFKGTGTYIVGEGEVTVVDPGPDDEAHLAALLRAVEGERVTHVLVTHTHRDHSPAAAGLAAATGAPTFGFGPHPERARRAEAARRAARAERADGAGEGDGAAEGEDEPGDLAFRPDVAVVDGTVVDTPAGRFTCLHTPGHISNHVCYAFEPERALFTGDHVMGWSTSVIPAPDGDMAAYLANLRRLLERDDAVYWPTHGPPITRPRPFVEALIEHREARERQVLGQLADGPRSIPEMVRVLYADVDEKLHEAAGRSVYAHLVKLVREGTVEAVPPAPPTDDAPPVDARYHLA